MNNIWNFVMCCVCPAGWPAGHPSIVCCKNFYVGHCTQTFQPNCFISAMLLGIVHFYHFLPLSLTLTLPGGHKVSTKQNLLASFLTHFSADQGETYRV